MQQSLLLQILLLAQHVSGTTMPIISSSRVLYIVCCLWHFMLWFSSCWFGAKLRVMCPVFRMLAGLHILTTIHGQNHIKFICPYLTCTNITKVYHKFYVTIHLPCFVCEMSLSSV